MLQQHYLVYFFSFFFIDCPDGLSFSTYYSLFIFSRMSLVSSSNTFPMLLLSLALVSMKPILYVSARFLPCLNVTFLSDSRSDLEPTIIMLVSVLLVYLICYIQFSMWLKLTASVMEYVSTMPLAPL